MGVLGVEDGVFVALAGGEVKVEVHRGVVASHEIEEAGDVASDALLLFSVSVRRGALANLVDEVDEGVDVAIALAHRRGLAFFQESHDLEDHDFQLLASGGGGLFVGLVRSLEQGGNYGV